MAPKVINKRSKIESQDTLRKGTKVTSSLQEASNIKASFDAQSVEESSEEEQISLFSSSMNKSLSISSRESDAPKVTEYPEHNGSLNKEDMTKIYSTDDFMKVFKIEWNKEPISSTSTFQTLKIGNWVTKTLNSLLIQKPTEIQQRCIPEILKGRDVIGRAKTGSGKTAAFTLPILQRLSEEPYGIFALVLSPTRELATQIKDQFLAFGKPINTQVSLITGGDSTQIQIQDINKIPHIVIATPGRLAALLKNPLVKFRSNDLKFLVLDEADCLFSETFIPDIETICQYLPPVKERQTLLFSATITKSMVLATLDQQRQKNIHAAQLKTASFNIPLLNNPVYIEANDESNNFVDKLDQRYLLVPYDVKEAYLVNLLKAYNPNLETYNKSKSCMIFTSSCKVAAFLNQFLTELSIPSTSLHSRLSQRERIAALGEFRSGVSKILITTDVGARGLDIPSVNLVINYELPRIIENYIHRVGRTARAGRYGQSITIVSQYDLDLFKLIEEKVNKTMDAYDIDEKEVLDDLKKIMQAKKYAKLSLENFSIQNISSKNKRFDSDFTNNNMFKKRKTSKTSLDNHS